MRIRVDYLLDGEERAGFFKVRGDLFVRLVGLQTCELPRVLGQSALPVNGNDDADLGVILADDEVFHAVTGSGMDAAGAAFECDVVADDYQRFAVEEGVLRSHVFELAALDSGGGDAVIAYAGGFHGAFGKLLRHNVILAVRGNDIVLEIGSEADGEVAGQRPRRRRPDYEIGLRAVNAVLRELALVVRDGELDVDGVALIVGILDLRLGKRRFVGGAPVNRLQTFVDIALLRHFAEYLDLLRFELGVQRQIRLFKTADDAETLELLLLRVHVFQRELAAVLAEADDVASRRAVLLDDLALDGKTVGIPAGYVRRTEARHVLVADDDVLQDLVQRVPEVYIAVGVGRAVMKHI